LRGQGIFFSAAGGQRPAPRGAPAGAWFAERRARTRECASRGHSSKGRRLLIAHQTPEVPDTDPGPAPPPVPPGPEIPPPGIHDPEPPSNPVPVREPPVMPTPMAE